MTKALDDDLSEDESRLIATRVRELLARRRLSRQQLADAAKISLSTLEKALAGRRPFTLATLVRLEQATGAPLRPVGRPRGEAPDSLGAYSRAGAAWLEGDYRTLRPSFEEAGAVYAYRTAIAWDEAASCLVFRESARLDAAFTQTGEVSLPHQSGHIYLHTNYRGQFRIATLGRPSITGALFGLLSTLHSGSGGHLSPIAVPIVLTPLHGATDARFGRIRSGEAGHEEDQAQLQRLVREGFVRMIGA